MTSASAAIYQHIVIEQHDRIGAITMNRPSRRNALSLEHMQELIAAFRRFGEDRTVAVIILKANGPAFCSGHDLSEMTGQTPEYYQHLFAVCTELMQTIQAIPQPVIAQVHGIATAAGCQLVATCDLAVAAEDARFATPGVKIGLFCSTPMVALSRVVSAKKAMEMLLTGDFISATEAKTEGLINRVVAANELTAATEALAQQIATASATVVGIGKRAFYGQLALPQEQAYTYAMEVMSANAALADAQEGMCAFLEKRQPKWQG